jgi:hypothetical protein
MPKERRLRRETIGFPLFVCRAAACLFLPSERERRCADCLHGATVCSYHLALFLPDFRFASSLSGKQPFDFGAEWRKS